MYIIVGLGNPGIEYLRTRHNAGFELLDVLADEMNVDINKDKFKSLVGEGFIENKKAILLKPLTYMNLSGEAVVQALNFYKPTEDEFIVVYDDISLEPGAIRIRKKGSSGGHNGIKSIINLTGSDKFHRIKIGVGSPKNNLVSHVLGKFSKEEDEEFTKGLILAKEAIHVILKDGIDEAMNKYNSSGKSVKEKKKQDKKEENKKELDSQEENKKELDSQEENTKDNNKSLGRDKNNEI